MRFKLDENFGSRTQCLFREAGHDIQTVREQKLQALRGQGIVVIRAPGNPNLALLEALIRQLLRALTATELEKELWIVEAARIRIHQSEE